LVYNNYYEVFMKYVDHTSFSRRRKFTEISDLIFFSYVVLLKNIFCK